MRADVKKGMERYGSGLPVKDFEWKDLTNPKWIAAHGAEMLPVMVSLMPLAIGGGALGAAGGTALGLSELGVGVTAAVTSAVASRFPESAMEALGTYGDMLDQGASKEQASEAAADVFKKNLALIGMDAGQYAAAFLKIPPGLRPFM